MLGHRDTRNGLLTNHLEHLPHRFIIVYNFNGCSSIANDASHGYGEDKSMASVGFELLWRDYLYAQI